MLDVGLNATARRSRFVFAGEPVAAYAAGVEICAQSRAAGKPHRAGGWRDHNGRRASPRHDVLLFGPLKVTTAAQHIVKGRRTHLSWWPNGSKGAGAEEFPSNGCARCRLVSAEFLDRLTGSPVTIDQWQLEKMSARGPGAAELHFYVLARSVELRRLAASSIHDAGKGPRRCFVSGMRVIVWSRLSWRGPTLPCPGGGAQYRPRFKAME